MLEQSREEPGTAMSYETKHRGQMEGNHVRVKKQVKVRPEAGETSKVSFKVLLE